MGKVALLASRAVATPKVSARHSLVIRRNILLLCVFVKSNIRSKVVFAMGKVAILCTIVLAVAILEVSAQHGLLILRSILLITTQDNNRAKVGFAMGKVAILCTIVLAVAILEVSAQHRLLLLFLICHVYSSKEKLVFYRVRVLAVETMLASQPPRACADRGLVDRRHYFCR
jgi:hypothetical protein